jgi:hypothetical protein
MITFPSSSQSKMPRVPPKCPLRPQPWPHKNSSPKPKKHTHTHKPLPHLHIPNYNYCKKIKNEPRKCFEKLLCFVTISNRKSYCKNPFLATTTTKFVELQPTTMHNRNNNKTH